MVWLISWDDQKSISFWQGFIFTSETESVQQEYDFLPADNRRKQPEIAHDEIERKIELNGRNRITN